VDDSPVVRQVIRRLVREHSDWEICGEAADGQDAVQKVRQLSPDLVILDFLMPGLNGLEAAREITRSTPKLPILLCTMHLSRQLTQLAEDVGITGTLSKNNLSDLVTGIETLLRGDRFFPVPT
jgi:DNA-binding NarL/FixJ family response regulator